MYYGYTHFNRQVLFKSHFPVHGFFILVNIHAFDYHSFSDNICNLLEGYSSLSRFPRPSESLLELNGYSIHIFKGIEIKLHNSRILLASTHYQIPKSLSYFQVFISAELQFSGLKSVVFLASKQGS